MEEECLNIGAIDDILNFTDLGDGDDEDDHLDKPRTKRPPLSSPHAAFLEEQEQEQEEELEWISNFPPVDEYVLAGDRGSIDKHQSPISVLENSTSSSNSNNNSNSSSNNSNSFIMSCCGSLRVPVRARNKRCRKRRRSFADIPGQQFWWSQENVKSSRAVITTTTTIGRKCQHCGAEKTPQWRAGPLGSKTLCNACGVRFKSGRLVPEYRPASSPTFSSQLHSNSHRKIIEMRRQKQWQTAPVKAADKG